MEHLATIDSAAWPRLVTLQRGFLAKQKARRAETSFAQACADAGIELDIAAPHGPDLLVEHDALFFRLARSGWLGLAEGYMAGEWLTSDSDALVDVLEKLIRSGYNPSAQAPKATHDDGGEVPHELVALYSGDGLSDHPGIFATGVPTTVREIFPSFVPRAGRGKEPKTHFVDQTTISEPTAIEREDLLHAQGRAATWLLDAAHVGAGTHILVHGGSGGRVAEEAARRRAIVDLISADTEFLEHLREQFILRGVSDSVHVQEVASAVPGPKEWRGRYEALVSVDKLALLTEQQREHFIASVDKLLAHGGRAALSTYVMSEDAPSSSQAALSVMRAYVWPGFNAPTFHEVHKLCERHSGLRIVAQSHCGPHAEPSLRLQRHKFEGKSREAAAAGFDEVFRRLWVFQFALREALLRAGHLDYVQFTAVHRSRGGRR